MNDSINSDFAPTTAERQQQRLKLDSASHISDVFARSGALLLRGAYESSDLLDARNVIADPVQFDQLQNISRVVGNQRVMNGLAIEGVFARPSLYANPMIIRIMHRLLGESFVLNSFGVVTAEPGAQPQQIHRDHPVIFHEDPCGYAAPPYAVTVLIPLTEVSLESGTTCLWEGSHRLAQDVALESTPTYATCEIGDCLLMDYRLMHGGTEVLQQQKQTVLYCVYSKPWFRDSVNFPYDYQVPISEDALNQMPVDLIHMFPRANLRNHRRELVRS